VSCHILIVDADETFATMLHQCLEEMRNTEADVVSSGKEALQATASMNYDLVIVDMGLPDVEPPFLIRSLRQEHPGLRLMVMPLEGAEAPSELADVNLQGVLSKPFFLPELPKQIQAALSHPLEGEAVGESQASQESFPVVQGQMPQATRLMSRLAQEVGAEAVLLIRTGELLAQAGHLEERDIAALVPVICDSWQTSARVAQILGKEQLRFEQSIEGEEHLLYSLALADETILSVIVEGEVPLGMIRHRAKETAEKIRGLVGM
jgi:DNA-binding NtrC family response regulator